MAETQPSIDSEDDGCFKPTRKINSEADKIAAGFKPDTAWGKPLDVQIDAETDAEIKRLLANVVKAKGLPPKR